MNHRNQEISSDWNDITRYLDRLDSDLLDSVLSKEYSGLEEFYKTLHETMSLQLSRERNKVRIYREELEKERSKRMELPSEKGLSE